MTRSLHLELLYWVWSTPSGADLSIEQPVGSLHLLLAKEPPKGSTISKGLGMIWFPLQLP